MVQGRCIFAHPLRVLIAHRTQRGAGAERPLVAIAPCCPYPRERQRMCRCADERASRSCYCGGLNGDWATKATLQTASGTAGNVMIEGMTSFSFLIETRITGCWGVSNKQSMAHLHHQAKHQRNARPRWRQWLPLFCGLPIARPVRLSHPASTHSVRRARSSTCRTATPSTTSGALGRRQCTLTRAKTAA